MSIYHQAQITAEDVIFSFIIRIFSYFFEEKSLGDFDDKSV